MEPFEAGFSLSMLLRSVHDVIGTSVLFVVEYSIIWMEFIHSLVERLFSFGNYE